MDDLQRNQPPRRIPGGRIRPSTHVDRQDLPGVTARERVTSILQVHDLEEAQRALSELTDADEAILRQIAREGAISGANSVIRYKAISALARRPFADNLNLLADLARFGEDFYVRGHAALALGQTGLVANLPLLLPLLDASEQFERTAASRALELIASRASAAAVESHALAVGGPEAAERVRATLSRARRAREGRTGERGESERREKRQ